MPPRLGARAGALAVAAVLAAACGNGGDPNVAMKAVTTTAPAAAAPATTAAPGPAAAAPGPTAHKMPPASPPPPAPPTPGVPAGTGSGGGIPAAARAADSSHPDHVVGTGTAASCTSAAVVSAVAA